MASYYVLTPPGSTKPEKDTVFIRDGFSWWAFLFPLPWLLARRLWLIAGLAVVMYLVTVLGAEMLGLDALPVAFSFILSLWTGLEGGHVRAHVLQKRGWQLEDIVAGIDIDDAEARYFADYIAPAAPTKTAIASTTGTRHADSVALGLIGPYGGR